MSKDSGNKTPPGVKNEWKVRKCLIDLHQQACQKLENDRSRWEVEGKDFSFQLARLKEYTDLTKEWVEFMTLPDNIVQGQIKEGVDKRISLILKGVDQGHQLAKDGLLPSCLCSHVKHKKWGEMKGNLQKLNLFFQENLPWQLAGFEIGEPLFVQPAVKCYRHLHHLGKMVFQLSFHKKILHAQNFLENKLNLRIKYDPNHTTGERAAFLQNVLIERVLPQYLQGIHKSAQRSLDAVTRALVEPRYALRVSA